MKQLTSIKTVMLCSLFIFSLSTVKANFINPVHTNWVNPMTGGEQNIQGESTIAYIHIDDDGYLVIKLKVTTTDHNVDNYAPLYIGYQFGIYEEHIPVLKDDLSPISEDGATGFRAEYERTLYFGDECPSGVRFFDLEVAFGLYTSSNGADFTLYDFYANYYLFYPSQYDNLDQSYSATKNISCHPIPPGGALVGQTEQDIMMDNPNLDLNNNEDTEILNSNFNPTLQEISISPNPFTEEMLLKYSLTSSSDVTILVSDINNQEILRHEIVKQTKGLQEYNIRLQSNIPPGVYFVTVYSSNMTKTTRVIKLNSK